MSKKNHDVVLGAAQRAPNAPDIVEAIAIEDEAVGLEEAAPLEPPRLEMQCRALPVISLGKGRLLNVGVAWVYKSSPCLKSCHGSRCSSHSAHAREGYGTNCPTLL